MKEIKHIPLEVLIDSLKWADRNTLHAFANLLLAILGNQPMHDDVDRAKIARDILRGVLE
jgi:hypothetical protein